jgi:photosystem II stability/assembly factor-like uncharacterized protein
MKKLILVIAVLFISTLSFGQSGWLSQTSNTSVLLWSVSFIDSFTGWAVGSSTSSGGIVKTTNGGINWVQQTSPITNGLNSVKFLDANIGYITAESGAVLKTTNGGSLWFSLTTGFGSALYCSHFFDANTGLVAGAIGVMLRTVNGGVNWSIIHAAPSNILFSGICFTNSMTGYAAGGNYPTSGSAYKTTNGGLNWFALTVGTLPVFEEVFFVDANTGWMTSNLGNIIKTTNAGANWFSQNISTSHNIFDAFFLNPNTGWVCGGSISGSSSSGVIWKTTNGGVNWYDQYNNQLIASLAMTSLTTGYGVGFNGTIVKTVTGGETVPLAPVLLSPANNSSNVSLTPTLFWNTVNGATSYKVLVSSMITFGNIVDSATVTTNQRTIPPGKLNIASTYYWKVCANNQYGSSPYSDAWNFSTVITGIEKISNDLPKSFSIAQNYPNPFNPTTSIKFDIPKSSFVKISIYDISGKEVATLVNEQLQPGTYETDWNASAFSSGVYFYKILAGNYTETKRMLLIK